MLLFLSQDQGQILVCFVIRLLYYSDYSVFVRLRDVTLAEEDAKAILTGCVATDESSTSN